MDNVVKGLVAGDFHDVPGDPDNRPPAQHVNRFALALGRVGNRQQQLQTLPEAYW